MAHSYEQMFGHDVDLKHEFMQLLGMVFGNTDMRADGRMATASFQPVAIDGVCINSTRNQDELGKVDYYIGESNCRTANFRS